MPKIAQNAKLEKLASLLQTSCHSATHLVGAANLSRSTTVQTVQSTKESGTNTKTHGI